VRAGWLSEFLARCGYWVVGVDISPDMVEIARQRVEEIPGPVGEGIEPLAEFHAMPVLETAVDGSVRRGRPLRHDAPLRQRARDARGDPADSRSGRAALHPRGCEPPPGSEGERNLLEEMERFGTLESPFDPEYLVSVVEEAGFVNVRRLVEVDELVDVAEPERRRDRLLERLVPDRLRARALGQAALRPEFNIVHASTRWPAGAGEGGEFEARIETDEEWEPHGRRAVSAASA
jgi:SAM-dependent methyltransferase